MIEIFLPFFYAHDTTSGRELDHERNQATIDRLQQHIDDRDSTIAELKSAKRKDAANWTVVNAAETAEFQAKQLESLTVKARQDAKTIKQHETQIADLMLDCLDDYDRYEKYWHESREQWKAATENDKQELATTKQELRAAKVEMANLGAEKRALSRNCADSEGDAYEEKLRAEKALEQNLENAEKQRQLANELEQLKNNLEVQVRTVNSQVEKIQTKYENTKKDLKDTNDRHEKEIANKEEKNQKLYTELRDQKRAHNDDKARHTQIQNVSEMNLKSLQTKSNEGKKQMKQLKVKIKELEDEVEGEKLVSATDASVRAAEALSASLEATKTDNKKLTKDLHKREEEIKKVNCELRKERQAHLLLKGGTQKTGNDSGLAQEEVVEIGEVVVTGVAQPPTEGSADKLVMDLEREDREKIGRLHRDNTEKAERILALQKEMELKTVEISEYQARDEKAEQTAQFYLVTIMGEGVTGCDDIPKGTPEDVRTVVKTLSARLNDKDRFISKITNESSKTVETLTATLTEREIEMTGYKTLWETMVAASIESAETQISFHEEAVNNGNAVEAELHEAQTEVATLTEAVVQLKNELDWSKKNKDQQQHTNRDPEQQSLISANNQIVELKAKARKHLQEAGAAQRQLHTDRTKQLAVDHIRKVADETEVKVQANRTRELARIRRELIQAKDGLVESKSKIENLGHEVETGKTVLGHCVDSAVHLLNNVGFALSETAKSELDQAVARENDMNKNHFKFEEYVKGRLEAADGHVRNLDGDFSDDGMPNSGITARPLPKVSEPEPEDPSSIQSTSGLNFTDTRTSDFDISATEGTPNESTTNSSAANLSLPAFTPVAPGKPVELPPAKRQRMSTPKVDLKRKICETDPKKKTPTPKKNKARKNKSKN